MSVSNRKDVSKLVVIYRKKYPKTERRILRKLIRLENKIENSSDLRKLDRYLQKVFRNKKATQDIKKTNNKDLEKTLLQLEEIGNIAMISSDAGWKKLSYVQATWPKAIKEKILVEVLPIGKDVSYSQSLALKIALDNISDIIRQYYKEVK